jgi:oligopeptide transport system permease protein
MLCRHVILNALGATIVTATRAVPSAIFTESFPSCIGLGVGVPMASWGVLTSEGVQAFRAYPYQLFLPAAAICVTMLAFNFVGDGLREALDPGTRRG